ncbi:MAG TPA: 16S rRNA (guanine(966)-N(2))-methyltransferase RsmD, partial [Candidatus Limnocylindrales bacterium]|nr:16S rRNA (guanine(966)-N(2))-methyltransferase RsmD [Candidatus Limnocylindrales bacterium]
APMADAGRVIAGSAKGVRLRAPGEGTRPLSDRVKQTLFAILEPDLEGAQFLDLFAGSGAAGIEALSRGAVSATFVEKDASAAGVIDANLGAARLAGAVVRADAETWLAREGIGPFDIVVVDPPYAETELLARVLERLGAADAPLRPGARVVAKHFWRDRPPDRIGMLAAERDRRFGETALTFYRRQEAQPE